MGKLFEAIFEAAAYAIIALGCLGFILLCLVIYGIFAVVT